MVPARMRRPPRTGSENPAPLAQQRAAPRPTTALARTMLLLLLLLAPAHPASAGDASLYEALGGQSGIAALADAYVDRLASADSTRRSFAGSNLRRIKLHLAAQICELAGGPCRYESDPMTEVHANLGISEAEFLAGVQALRDLMRERGIPLGTTNRLLALLAPMKRDIVDVRVGAPSTRGADATHAD